MNLFGPYGYNLDLINTILSAAKLMGHIKIRNNVITGRERGILDNKYIPFCSKAKYHTWLPLEFSGNKRFAARAENKNQTPACTSPEVARLPREPGRQLAPLLTRWECSGGRAFQLPLCPRSAQAT